MASKFKIPPKQPRYVVTYHFEHPPAYLNKFPKEYLLPETCIKSVYDLKTKEYVFAPPDDSIKPVIKNQLSLF